MGGIRATSFSAKLFLANAFYLLPCAVLTFFLIKDKNSGLEFSQMERAGNEYQRPLQNLLFQVSDHKLLAAAILGGEEELKSDITMLGGQIDRAFADLEEVNGRLSESLQFGEPALALRKRNAASPSVIKSSWQTLKGQWEQRGPAESNESHTQLISALRLAITHMGDTSNLILDPDLDSYYLMDITLLAVPQLEERIQEVISFANENIKEGVANPEAMQRLAIFAALMAGDLERIQSNIQTALSEDKNFNGISPSLQRDLPYAFSDFTAALSLNIKAIQALAREPSPKAESVAALTTGGRKAIAAANQFWLKSVDELDKLLAIRLDSMSRGRTLALTLALLAWLPPILLAFIVAHRLNKSFISAVARLKSEAAAASDSSSKLASASQTVSTSTTEQAAAIQETGASMSEMASMITRSSDQTVSSKALARKVTERTDEGGRVIERMVSSMESIQEANAQLQNISNIISEISAKTNVINDIVGKTQLLSFNASIEAARAGQHGRGFAVVAEEVGNLARMSGNAAKEIRDLIEDSQKQVAHILKSTLDRVSEGKVVTEQTQDIFSQIAKDISLISTQIESIAEASREQQVGVEQISKAMAQMDHTTQSNNSAAHLAAMLSDQLMSQSLKLTTIAHGLSELVLGKIPRREQRNGGGSGEPRAPEASRDRPRLALHDTQSHGHAHYSVHGHDQREREGERIVESLKQKDRDLSAEAALAHDLNADDESFKRVS